MFDMTAYAAIRRLLDAVGRIEDRLGPNERDLYRELAIKYSEPVPTDASDATCLEVLLRNVEIRKRYGADPVKDTERVIEPVPRRGPKR